MRRILIIRSISLQQLDKNLPAIRAKFPDAALYLLTHEHARAAAEKYADLAGVLVYPHEGGFRRGKFRPDPSFDAVITPVSNLGGAGFLNVMQFAQSIPARERWRCNLVGELEPVNAGWLRRKLASHYLQKMLALLATALVLPLFLTFLILRLPRLEGRPSDV